MADLYPPSYSARQPYHRHPDDHQQQYNPSPLQVYPPQLMNSQPSGSSNNSSDENHDQPPSPSKSSDHQPPKTEAKPQATFLTKLYALLERPDNHHMIRWDPAGEHIIVERPEQLALHVLPSIYRQSRFASFSRQLNIYGFMRKVNLRNVDPAIDDPDASTWSHPTLNRHSPPEVVANFKRRVPPRLPKPRKRDAQEQSSLPPQRSAIGMGPVPLTVPSSIGHPSHKLVGGARARGFSAPGSFTPLSQGGAAGWGNSYTRSALPPLMVPSDPPHISQQNNMYNHSPHTLHPITPSDDTPSSNYHTMSTYSSSNRDMVVPSSQYSYPEQNSWSFANNGSSSSHNGSLSSLLNPSNGYSRPTPTINTSYGSPFSSMPMQGEHSASSLSPDSRPTTGYSMSSVSSLPYQDDYSRPSSSHHRPISPPRPGSSKSTYNAGSLSVRRARRHSQAMSPYPSPYDHNEQQRPSTSPQPVDDHHSSGIPRVRSMIQLPSVDPYSFNPSQAEFAYSAIPGAVGHTATMESMNDTNGWGHRNVRPSTSTSSISAASHTSSSQANTPPVPENYNGETDINRFSPDFGFVPMNEHLPHHYNKVAGDL
ncbi:HSF-type DNA-binding-domain-containing protein [Crassisporium funariophilum]|nr:HSF-type DNA-binding-domain-containing protein [Crassisporium funariophilum]